MISEKHIKYVLIFAMSIATLSGSLAQKFPSDKFQNLKIRNVGPANMSGRITAIAAVADTPTKVIYIGAASGGVWKSENGGTAWESIFDDAPTVNIGAIAVQQSNPSVVWAGTGEGNPRNSMNLGLGLFKSLDAGKTWKRVGLENSKTIHRIIIDPSDGNTVYVGVMGDPFTPHTERGLYKTTDGGLTWKKILYTNDKSGVADLVMDPTNPNKLLAAMYEHRRTPYSFTSGGPGSGLYMTYNGGETWKRLSEKEGLPAGELGRIGLAIAPSNPDRIYAKVEATKNALYRSDDGGLSWKMINDNPRFTNNRPFYFQELAVDTKDPNRLYNIYQPLHVSYDGGVSFDPVPMIPADETKGIHADFHAFWVDPNDPTFFIIGGDGGIGITHDHGKAWYFPETIPVAQFYHINVDEDMPYNVYGGMQDNGNWSGPGYVWKRGGIRTLYWQYLVGGDGFIIQPDSVDSRFGYGTSQNGELYRYDKLTGYYQHIQPRAPNMNTRLRYNWNAGFAQDPNNNDVAYHGSQFVHKTTDKGKTWTIISPDLTTNNPDHQKQDYGGLTIDASGAEIYNSIISLAVSYLDKNVIWAGSDDGLVHLTKDGGKTWTNVTANIKGLPKQAWLAQMQTSSHKAGEVWLVANNYRQGDYAPYLFRTQDYGKTWVRMAEASQVKGYALSVMPDSKEPKLVFLGTENGLWISIDEGKTWEQFKNGFPSVSTMDMTIQQRESALIVGTFGRAIWVLDDLLSLRELAKGKLDQQPLTALPVNDAVQVKGLFINPPGNIWTGFYTTFEGANKPFQKVEIPFFIKDNKAGDKAMAEMYNANNQLIQTISTDSVVAGLNYITWKLDEQMARLPGAWAGEDSRDIPVLPGDYKIVVKYGDASSETAVKVIPDPRFEYDEEVDKAVYTLSKRLNVSTEKLASAMARLQASDKTIEHVLTQAKAVAAKEVVTASEAIQQKIKALNDLARAPRPDKQVGAWQSFAVTATSKMSDAAQALRGRLFVPTSQDVKVIEEAEQLVGDFVKAVDSFYATEWAAYKKQVEEAELSWFRE
ncbi:hypothetical protein RT717_04410 [Imperialibacter roseus]|uniref:Sortilin N-terminal domain-containing protein n=1 Tax=Imperialibacter roseus TaxID=1324217 RepID=A0ABZ0ITY2_9BACT|nr:hypothetical protein [Imperialibacter roseus]WOK07869.1 hypothetical protein RT717_04410 [Imperialibacter roseus]